MKKIFFGEFYADTFSDCPSDIYTSLSEDDSSSEYSSDSGDVNIRPTESLILIRKVKMKLKVLELAPLLLQKSGLKTTFHKN